MKVMLTNIKIYYLITFRNPFLLIANYLLPIAFYLLFSSIFISIDPSNKIGVITNMSIFAMLMSSCIALPGVTVKYSNGDIRKAYVASGIKLWHVFLSVGINNVIHALLCSAFILLTAPLIFGATLHSNLGEYITVLLMGAVLLTLIGLFIGLYSKSESISTVVSQLVFLPSMFLSGITLDESFLPTFLQHFSKIIPAKYILLLMRDFNIGSLLVLLCMIVVIFALLIIRYKNIVRKE
jgi:ABC-2 type transport system permease protein